MSFDPPQDSFDQAPDPLREAIRSRLRPMKAPESLRLRIAAMLAAERRPVP